MQSLREIDCRAAPFFILAQKFRIAISYKASIENSDLHMFVAIDELEQQFLLMTQEKQEFFSVRLDIVPYVY